MVSKGQSSSSSSVVMSDNTSVSVGGACPGRVVFIVNLLGFRVCRKRLTLHLCLINVLHIKGAIISATLILLFERVSEVQSQNWEGYLYLFT